MAASRGGPRRRRVRRDDGAAIALTGTAAAVALLYVFRSILWPFAFALVLAILMQAFIRAVTGLWPWLDRRVVVLMCAAAALGLILAADLVVLPGLAQLVGDLPRVQQRIDSLLAAGSARMDLDSPVTLETLLGGVDVRAAALWALRSLRDLAAGLVLTALFLIFLLFWWNAIERRIRLAAGRRGTWPARVLDRSIRAVEAYLWIQTIGGLANAIGAGLIMLAAGLEHWHFWAIALFMLSYIPFLGVAVGSVAPALFALLQFPSATQGLLIFLGIQAVAFVVGNLLIPRIQASAQNIDPSAGLLAVGVWSILWALPGAFLAIPLTLALIYHFAGTPRLQWLAILLSNDGHPLGRPGKRPPEDQPGPEP